MQHKSSVIGGEVYTTHDWLTCFKKLDFRLVSILNIYFEVNPINHEFLKLTRPSLKLETSNVVSTVKPV